MNTNELTCNRRKRQEEDDRPLQLDLRGNVGGEQREHDLQECEWDVEEDRLELIEAEALCMPRLEEEIESSL